MTKLDTTIIDENSVSPFTTLPAEHHPDGKIPAGQTFVTPDELRYLTELNYGPDAVRITCDACGEVMVFEKHPADWSNHPGKPGEVRVKIECPRCGHMQYTDGGDEATYVAARTADLYRKVSEEVAKRLQAENGGEPVAVEQIGHSDAGGGTGEGAGGAATA